MTSKKIILIIIGLIIIVGLGFVFLKPHNGVDTTINTPTPLPTQTTPTTPIKNDSPQFGKAVTLQMDKKITFSDGLAVALTHIDDSRCPAKVQCIWAGELSAVLEVSGGTIKYPGEVHVSTVTNKTIKVEDYTVSLTSATTKTATIIVTKKSSTTTTACYIGGCSREVCSDQKNAVSNCIYTEKYACYQTATCERQASGQCGWTQTPVLTACLSK